MIARALMALVAAAALAAPARASFVGVALAPDGKTIAATVAGDKTIHVVELATGKEVLAIACAEDPRPVAFSPDGKTLAAGVHHALVLFDAATGKILAKVDKAIPPADQDDAPGAVERIAFAPDGRTVAIGGPGVPGVRLLHVPDCKQVRVLDGLEDGQTTVVFSRDGKKVAAGSRASNGPSSVLVWAADTGKTISSISGEFGTVVEDVQFAPDGKSLVVVDQDMPGGNKVTLWDAATGKSLGKIEADSGWTFRAAFGPDGKTLYFTGERAIHVWDLGESKRTAKIDAPKEGPIFLLFKSDGKQLVTANGDETIRVYDLAARKKEAVMRLKAPAGGK